MGLFDTIFKDVTTLVTHPLLSLEEGAKAVAGIVANPGTALSSGIMAAEKKVATQGLATSIGKIVTNTAVAGASILLPATAGGRAFIGGIVESHPLASAITGLGAATIGVGAISSNPSGAISSIVDAPSSFTNFGANIGTAISNPSIKNITDIFRENPLISSASVLGAGLLAGTTLNTVATALNTRATNTNSNAGTPDYSNASTPINITNQIPATTPSVTTSAEGGSTKKKKATKKKATKKKATKKKATKKKSKTIKTSKTKKKSKKKVKK